MMPQFLDIILFKSQLYIYRDSHENIDKMQEMIHSTAGYRQFARHPQDEKNMRDVRKKGRTRDNVKFNTHVSRFDYFFVQLFYSLSYEKIPLSRA